MILFANPWLLLALLGLPLLWLWLKYRTPPLPKRHLFPSTRFIATERQKHRTPLASKKRAQTPIWLRLLRVLTIATLILACASPFLPAENTITHDETDALVKNIIANPRQPVAILIDNGWSSATAWHHLQETLSQTIAILPDNLFTVIPTATPPKTPPTPLNARQAQETAKTLTAQAWFIDRINTLKALQAMPTPPQMLFWLNDGIASQAKNQLKNDLQSYARQQDIPFYQLRLHTNADASLHPPPILTPPQDNDAKTLATITTSTTDANRLYTLSAYDDKQNLLFTQPYQLNQKTLAVHLPKDSPPHFVNQIHYLKLTADASFDAHQMPNAAQTFFLAASRHKPTIALLHPTVQPPPPLLDPNHYIATALAPRQLPITNTPIEDALSQNPSLIFWHDEYTILNQEQQQALATWLKKGGTLIRFGGKNTLSQQHPDLTPAALQEISSHAESLFAAPDKTPTTRILFMPTSPLYDFDSITTQITPQLAFLNNHPPQSPQPQIWAQTQDNRPVISARSVGQGWLVFFHQPIAPLRSDLAFSQHFPAILTTLTQIENQNATKTQNRPTTPAAQHAQQAEPISLLDGWGNLQPPQDHNTAITTATATPSAVTPPGLYATAYQTHAFNLSAFLPTPPRLADYNDIPVFALATAPPPPPPDINPWLVVTILMLITMETALLRAVAIVLIVLSLPMQSQAQPYFYPQLAYMLTQDAQQNAISRQGLKRLTDYINQRTSIQLDEPLAITPYHDALPFMTLIYWPIGQDSQPLDSQAENRLRNYLSNGGIILFAVKDQQAARIMTLPAIEPIDAQHAINRSFFLLPTEIWRHARLSMPWTDQSQNQNQTETATIITMQDNIARIWQEDERNIRTEIALRIGLNIVLYALTGNYKLDQIHALTIIDRLKR